MKSSNLGYFTLRYGCAVFCIALAIWVRLLLDPVLGNTLPYATLFVAVMLTAWYGGLRPAVLAVVLGAFAANYFLLPPRGILTLVGVRDQVGLLLYLAAGCGIALLGGAMHKARQNAEAGAMALRESNEQLEARVRERTAELARNNELIRTSEARMAGIVNSAMDAIITVDSTQRIVLFNAAAEKMFRSSAAEAIGQPLDILIPERFRPQHREHLEGFGKTGVSSRSMDSLPTLTGRRSDGEEFPVEASISLVKVDGENIFTVILRDVTERARAEKALQASELRYRRLFESAQDGILILDANTGKIVDVNPFLTEMLGFSQEGLVGKALWEIGVFSGVLSSKAAFAELQEHGYIRYEDLPLKTHDGHIKQVEFVSNSYQAGGLRVIQCNIRDITESKQAEAALRDGGERLRLAQQVARIGTFEWNIQTGVNQWTPELESMYGLPPGGFAGTQQTWEELIHSEDRAEAVRQISLAMEGKNFEAEWRVIWPDGNVHWLAGRALVFKDERGNPLRLLGVNIDITERKQAEDALRESESRFRQLAESLPQLVWTCQPDGPCDYLNRQWIEFTGVPADQQYGFGWLEQLHPGDRAPSMAAWEEAVASGADFRVEFRIRRHDGEYRWFDTRAVRLRDAGGATVKWVGSNTDMTERKRAEEILRQQAEELRARNAELTRFNRVTVGRELRLIELKMQVNSLAAQLDQPPPYSLAFMDAPAAEVVRTTLRHMETPPLLGQPRTTDQGKK